MESLWGEFNLDIGVPLQKFVDELLEEEIAEWVDKKEIIGISF